MNERGHRTLVSPGTADPGRHEVPAGGTAPSDPQTGWAYYDTAKKNVIHLGWGVVAGYCKGWY